jgi:MoaA/NifB/PqqE/SkfB family radical SAM enzyme
MSENNIEKSFCVLPWLQLHMMPDSSVTPCCVSPFSDSFGNASKQNFLDIWNGPKFKLLRQQMLEGVLPETCRHCYKIEEAGFPSLRTQMNKKFSADTEELKKNANPDGTAEVKLKALDIRFSNMCNFKCRGCGSELSHSWYEDHVALKRTSPDAPKLRRIKVDSPNFWNEFPNMINDLEYIYFGGGEPLITKEHFDLLRLLIDRKQTNINLFYNTNLSALNYEGKNLVELWKQFRWVDIAVSLDDIEHRAEYFRHGTDWATVTGNMKKIRDLDDKIKTYINCTVSNMNVYYLPEFFEYVMRENLTNTGTVMINLLQSPPELSVTALPASAKLEVMRKLKAYKENLIERNLSSIGDDIQKVMDAMMRSDDSRLFGEFLSYTKTLDDLRGESFQATYPELFLHLFP